jgi:hypothetical protein
MSKETMSLRHRTYSTACRISPGRYHQAGSISIFPLSCTFLRKPMRLSSDFSRTHHGHGLGEDGKRQPCEAVRTGGDEFVGVRFATGFIYQQLRLIFSYQKSASLSISPLSTCDRPHIYKDIALGNLSRFLDLSLE